MVSISKQQLNKLNPLNGFRFNAQDMLADTYNFLVEFDDVQVGCLSVEYNRKERQLWITKAHMTSDGKYLDKCDTEDADGNMIPSTLAALESCKDAKSIRITPMDSWGNYDYTMTFGFTRSERIIANLNEDLIGEVLLYHGVADVRKIWRSGHFELGSNKKKTTLH